MAPHGSKELAKRKKRLARSGLTPTGVVDSIKSDPTPTAFRVLAGGTQRRHDRVASNFEVYLKTYEPVVRGNKVRSTAEWVESKCGYPPTKVISGIFRLYLRGAKGLNSERPDAKTVMNTMQILNAVMRRRFDIIPTKDELAVSKAAILNLVNEKSLVYQTPKRPYWTLQSFFHFCDKVWEPDFVSSFRLRFSMTLFGSASFINGLRPNSLLRASYRLSETFTSQQRSDEDHRRAGARYGHFKFVVCPSGVYNKVVAGYRATWAKTSSTARREFDLRQGATISSSPPLMALVALVLDRHLTVEDFTRIMSPGFVREGPVGLASSQGQNKKGDRGIDVKRLSLKVKQVTCLLGWKTPATAGGFRHGHNHVLQAAGVPLTKIRDSMTHQTHSAATAAYSGRHMNFDMRLPLATKDGNIASSAPKARVSKDNLDSLRDDGAVRGLTEEDSSVIDEATLGERLEYERLRADPSIPRLKVTEARTRLIANRRRAQDATLQTRRKEYHDALTTMTPEEVARHAQRVQSLGYAPSSPPTLEDEVRAVMRQSPTDLTDLISLLPRMVVACQPVGRRKRDTTGMSDDAADECRREDDTDEDRDEDMDDDHKDTEDQDADAEGEDEEDDGGRLFGLGPVYDDPEPDPSCADIQHPDDQEDQENDMEDEEGDVTEGSGDQTTWVDYNDIDFADPEFWEGVD